MRNPCKIRVASRYIKAGLLKVPPAMVKEITKWAQDTFCMWIVKDTKGLNRDLIQQVWREERSLESIDRSEAMDLRRTLRDLKYWGSRPKSRGRFSDLLEDSKGTLREYLVSLNVNLREMSQQEAKALYDQTFKRFLPILEREIKKADREYLKASERIDFLQSKFTSADHAAYQNRFIPDTLKVSPEVLQSAKKKVKI